MEYTVGELAKLSGVTNKTIRYYDETGLLKPSGYTEAGYRIYGELEVDKLQQILFYRSFGVELKTIKKIMCSPDFDEITSLKDHRKELLKEKRRIGNLLKTLDKTIDSKERGIKMPNKEKFKAFKEELIKENEEKYGEEIREKYGDEKIDDSNKAFKNMTKQEYENFQKIEKEFKEMLFKATEKGDVDSSEARKAANLHKEWLIIAWGGKTKYSKEAHLGLAQMYRADQRFHEYFGDDMEALKILSKSIEKHL